MRDHNWCNFISVLSLLVFCAWATSAQAQLRISEVLSAPGSDWDADGIVDSKLDEWIEVTNTGVDPVDLTDVFLRDGTGTAWHYGFSGTLAPGAIELVTGAASLQWQEANGAGTSGLSLNNSGDLVELWRAPAAGAASLLDSTTVPGHAAVSDRAYAWLAGQSVWILHDGLNPYGGDLVPTGTGCEPSPGQANLCTAIVPTEELSFGRVKAVWEN